jgi:phospholipid/cholesterol/gamma-HCH transport system ATP-binding protein
VSRNSEPSAGTNGRQCILRVLDIYKRFAGLRVLKGVSLDVCTGETLVVIGGSGCGKSVLLKHIIGILRPDEGRVIFDGAEISSMSDVELAVVRRRFAMVFQLSALFDSLTVKENVAFGLRRHTDYDEERISEIVGEKLRLVGLRGVEEKMPAELSGGMKKRVAIARAIATEPEVILYDEPTTGLDPIMADVVNELILRVQERQKTTSVVVTHDMNSAYKVATRIAMLDEGRIVEIGTPEEIQNTENPVVAQFIRGEARDYIEQTVK